MLEDGQSIVPEPYQDLEKAARWATASILRAQADGVPSENVERVRDFVTACDALKAMALATQKALDATAPQPPAPPGGAPPGQPQQGLPAAQSMPAA
jgi:hypothetical protein